MNDTERLDWLANQQGIAVIRQDDGRWAVVETSYQNRGEFPDSSEVTAVVSDDQWCGTLRDAVDQAIKFDQVVEEAAQKQEQNDDPRPE